MLVQMDGQADGLELPVEVASHIFLVDAAPQVLNRPRRPRRPCGPCASLDVGWESPPRTLRDIFVTFG